MLDFVKPRSLISDSCLFDVYVCQFKIVLSKKDSDVDTFVVR